VAGVSQIQRKLPLLVLLLGSGLVPVPALAQFTGSNQTNTISAITSLWPGNYYVGSNTWADALLIRGAGVLSNADALIGYLPASSNNYALVTGAGSVWSNANLYLGASGIGNVLVISNAGRVENSQNAYIANDSASSSNRLLVTGTNSVLDTTSSLFVGNSGVSNGLVISNGGCVANATGYLGNNLSSSGNSALITGAGSAWSNHSSFVVGYHGNNNKLTISKGGRLYSAYATIGFWETASSNSVVLSDSGSLWDNSAEASDINVGWMSSGNRLIVTNGGQVMGYYTYVGRNDCGYNSAIVTGPGSSLTVNCYIFTGSQGHDNSFTAANGAVISDKFCYVSSAAGSTNNSVLVTDTNTSWQNSYSVYVGFDGAAGGLIISNGATMSSGGAWGVTHDGALGVNADSSNNWALVTGAGSVWNIADSAYIGLNGPGNSLVISNGGKVICTTGYVGSNPGSDNNRALIVGAESAWNNSSDLYVGDFTLGNSLVLSNGGQAFSQNGFVGGTSGSTNNSVLLTGTGSSWANSANVSIGYRGATNSLVISNGARLSDDWGVIGFLPESGNNQALVTGAGSVWSNVTGVLVGYYGCGNTLDIRDDGLVSGYWGVIGDQDSSSDNAVRVGVGGFWINQLLLVGNEGSHNALFVDGGTITAEYMCVGNNSLYCNNLTELDSGAISVTNSTHDAVLEIYNGSFFLTGGTLLVDTLVITNPCAQFIQVGGALIYHNLILNPDADADGDGIPNGWEQVRGLDPFNPFDAADDNDSDGMSNLQEYLAGTDPNSSASCLRIISAVRTSNDIRIEWKAVGAKSYVVQSSASPAAGFTDLSPVIPVPGTAEVIANYVHSGGATNGPAAYYRVRLGP
jgi:T5SS/PEP-CTERM-associated repeat protein